MNEELARIRVERGAVKMDELRPDWFKTIDEERLDIFSNSDCIMGQIKEQEGQEGRTVRFARNLGLSYVQQIEHGFVVTENDGPMYTELWKAQIAARKTTAG